MNASHRLPASAGVIGWPVAHSKSPQIHRFWLARLGIEGDYGRFPVEPSFLGDAIRALPALGLRGVNVTVPHKVHVMEHLDRIDPLAERVGAVNTIVVEDWELAGYNTDAVGFIEPLLPLLANQRDVLSKNEPARRTAHLIGCGGAALAIAEALIAEGFLIVAYSRDPKRAASVLKRFEVDEHFSFSLERLAQSPLCWPGEWNRFDLVVNATPLGMSGPSPVVAFDNFPSDSIVYDIVYSPLETPLLAAARARGLRTIDGLAMLIGQAAAAFEKFFGAPAPREHDAELRALLTA